MAGNYYTIWGVPASIAIYWIETEQGKMTDGFGWLSLTRTPNWAPIEWLASQFMLPDEKQNNQNILSHILWVENSQDKKRKENK